MTNDKDPIQMAIDALENIGRNVFEKSDDGRDAYEQLQEALTALRQYQQDVKPVFYCENGQSLDGLEKGAMAVLANLMIKTNADTADFMIGNENDGEFHFTCKRTPPAPKKENDDA